MRTIGAANPIEGQLRLLLFATHLDDEGAQKLRCSAVGLYVCLSHLCCAQTFLGRFSMPFPINHRHDCCDPATIWELRLLIRLLGSTGAFPVRDERSSRI